MRQIIDPQLQFGEQDISAIKLDPRSRDDIPQILRGLQYIYTTPEVREPVFAILAQVLAPRAEGEGAVSAETGRPGMAQWKILVLGTLRLNAINLVISQKGVATIPVTYDNELMLSKSYQA